MNQRNRNVDLHDLIKLRKEFGNNPVIGYINNLDSKIDDLRDIYRKSPNDVLCIAETKLDSFCTDPQLKILGYRIHRTAKAETNMVVVKHVLKRFKIARRLRDFEGDTAEIICLELTVSRKICFMVFAC